MKVEDWNKSNRDTKIYGLLSSDVTYMQLELKKRERDAMGKKFEGIIDKTF